MKWMKGQNTELFTDVLVIGGGGTAMRAALEACDCGAKVIMAIKGEFGKSGATYCSVAEIGAFNVPDGAADPSDNPDAFYQDIMDASLKMADPRLARIVADQACRAKAELEGYGMRFAKTETGDYLCYRACFSTKPRSHVVENHFKPIVNALAAQIKKREITVLERAMVTDLLLCGGVCCGAYALLDGQLAVIHSRAVVIAAGGASRLFAHNLYPADITGDGYAMAWRAGAEISNMEFIQAGIGLAWPEVNLFGNQLWEAVPRLTNGRGERFIENYTGGLASEEEVIRTKGRHFPFSTRDCSKYLEIAVHKEMAEGCPTKRGNVYLDFLDTDFKALFSNPESPLKAMWPMTYKRFLELGVDLYREKIEIACFAHAINGGIRINERGESSVQGLYAAGEAASGPHGADRLGGNMSVTCQVFGKIAGRNAAEYARCAEWGEAGDVSAEEAFLSRFGEISQQDAEALKTELQAAADGSLLIERSEKKLLDFIRKTEEWKDRLRTGLKTAGTPAPLSGRLELYNLLETGRIIALSALRRKESRGSHYRSDYPELSEEFDRPIVLERNASGELL